MSRLKDQHDDDTEYHDFTDACQHFKQWLKLITPSCGCTLPETIRLRPSTKLPTRTGQHDHLLPIDHFLCRFGGAVQAYNSRYNNTYL